MTTRENQRAMGDPAERARNAEEYVKEKAGQASKAVVEIRRRLAAALDAAKDTYDRLQDRTVETAKATDRCIRDHPWETLGVALGLGLLIGVLAARR